jgi:hypothetical protein
METTTDENCLETATSVVRRAGYGQMRANPTATAHQMVDAVTGLSAIHSRAAHAKGTILEGTFTPDPSGPPTSTRPSYFSGASVRAIGEFSEFTGIPAAPTRLAMQIDAASRGNSRFQMMPRSTSFAHSIRQIPN